MGGPYFIGELNVKHLIETKGAFMLIDPQTRQVIPENRPSVVTSTTFLEERISKGQVSLVAADISEGATDEEFATYWTEKPEIAVEAFLSKFDEGPLLDPELVKDLEAAVELLAEGDFQKDGKPKVGALDKLIEGTKIDTAIRDTFWANR